MRIRKPNRVTTAKWAVLNGPRACDASMPRTRGRWRPDFTRNRASAAGRGETARPHEHRQDARRRREGQVRAGSATRCTATSGPNAGDMLIDLTIRLYLSPEEYARYEGSESLQITLNDNRNGCLPACTKAPDAGGLS